ncbi:MULTISPECIES: helix-turn-helix domain-containing protein [Virgibacillus]|uniref:helix-turn-helix domain-containing protein n=1 Tax=Virgibacillus TaxID=84406 RepID=UPI0009568C5B|nr:MULTISPECIES: helix-turn-helix domain-containing protein [Virgibacillus]MBS7429372.1 helix-turn-helix domain-containing protein [Virgibacillus sp. 19R1-5]MED3737810.1 helix-turn-helix domain-containing protein [Virgibacillus pantothenticus]QTY15115.1 helix-turn-helix domain-containing protein [Virgibacillus pantothenticus]SIT14104.1 Helix-turn-helix domain-containing protein [Virgibacillus pantothenticus]
MNSSNLLEAVENGDLIQILSIFEPTIKKNLRNTTYQERSDLEQEIAIKILEKMVKFKALEAPSFFEFIDCEKG